MQRPLIILSQSDSLIPIVYINSDTKRQAVQIQISQLIWIYMFAKAGYIQAQQDKS